MTTEQIESVKDTTETIIRMESELRKRIMRQSNQITVALAYLNSDQPHLAKLVLEGMEP